MKTVYDRSTGHHRNGEDNDIAADETGHRLLLRARMRRWRIGPRTYWCATGTFRVVKLNRRPRVPVVSRPVSGDVLAPALVLSSLEPC
jgi:hypothetical protein